MQRPWLNHYDADVKPNMEYQIRPLFEFLDMAAEKWPRQRAVWFQNWKVTYAKLKKLTEIFAANLKAQGVRPGDRVALMLPNSPQAIIGYWGALRAGAVVVMTNPLYMETELVHQLNDAKVKVMVALDLLWPKLEKIMHKVPVEKYFITSMSDALAFPLNHLYRVKSWREGRIPDVPYDNKRFFTWKALIKGKDTYTYRGVDPNGPALLQYTGGTTGISKGCVLTHANLATNMQQCRNMLSDLKDGQETMVGVLPYFHIFGLTVCVNFPTFMGATLVPFPRYVPKDLLKTMHKIKPTIFPGAPSIYISLLQQKDIAKYDLTSIGYCISGSAPMPVDYINKFMDITGAGIVEGYGLTEASPVTHINPLKGTHKPGSIGLPFPDTDARIVDMEVGSVDMPPGAMGELVIRGPQVMQGYLDRPDDTASVIRNGWLYTGDVAYMDEDGYFFIVDRKKDLILSGGYNIYPREIDEVLVEHPKIKEAVAVGIPHEARGELVKAYIVLEDGEKMGKKDVIGYCREKLANYKVPRQVEFRTDLPKTMVGKVLRRALRAEEEEKLAAKKKNKK